MSVFKDTSSDEWNPANMVPTGYGFSLALDHMPSRHDIRWLKLPERHIYEFDGDGWYRLDPPESKRLPAGEIPHG
jgi:hypothetical protein